MVKPVIVPRKAIATPHSKVLSALMLVALWQAPFGTSAWAREQSQINHPAGSPPSAPLHSGSAGMGFVPQFNPDFWKGQLVNRVPNGTVLSGVLENDLASDESQKGDIFEIHLDDGFVMNGKAVIPPHSKIVGHVVDAVPAKTLRHGHPGRLQISLQSLVMPDGRHVPFHGFVDANPNHAPKDEPQSRNHGKSIGDYGQSVGAFFGSFTSGFGFQLNKRHRGLDFELDKGEVLPIRLTRSLEIPAPVDGTASNVPGLVGQSMSAPPGSYLGTTNAPGMQGPGQIAAPARNLVPGLVGPDPDAPYVPPRSLPAMVPGQAVSPPQEDPNAVFSQPVRPRPLADMPDPF